MILLKIIDKIILKKISQNMVILTKMENNVMVMLMPKKKPKTQ